MPLIKSAIKKLRKDRVRTARNKAKKDNLKSLIKNVRREKSAQNLQAVYSALDKAAKTHLIHPNKASRLKSRLSKLVAQPTFTSESKTARLKSRLSKGISAPVGQVKKASKKKVTKKIKK